MIIGNNGYGKPILDRVLKYQSTLKFALKAGFLSFNATRVSANDVEYPIDVIYYEKDSFSIIERRYKKDELQSVSKLWQNQLSDAVSRLPDEWIDKIFQECPPDERLKEQELELD